MEALKKKILEKGIVVDEHTLKVDSFLNHQLDTSLISSMAEELIRRFAGTPVHRILTIESSGIPLAFMMGYFLHIPVVFAKKTKPSTFTSSLYSAESYSFTRKSPYTMSVSRDFLPRGEEVLIVDDFLAGGNAVSALIEIIRKAGSRPAGVAIAVEKGFQGGGDSLREAGIHVESLAIIESLANGVIQFRT